MSADTGQSDDGMSRAERLRAAAERYRAAGAAILRIRANGKRPKGTEWTATQVWHNTDVPMYMSSPVVDGGFLYGFSNRRKGQLFCLEAATGRVRWATEGRGGTNASLVSAGPNLVMLTTEGDLLIVMKSPEKYEELHRYKVADSGTWAQPVVLKDGILIRDAQSVSLLGL